MISIIDYNSGNIASVQNALKKINKSFQVISVFDKNFESEIQASSHIIFPGVGHAQHAMEELNKAGVQDILKNITQPFLGICLGMQVLGKFSKEGNQECLGIFDFHVEKFQSDTLPVPHMGWNNCHFDERSPLFKDIPQNSDMYFVHSYFIPKNSQSIVETDYIQNFCAGIQKDNFYALQFHPEKSGNLGLKILQNFCNL